MFKAIIYEGFKVLSSILTGGGAKFVSLRI